MANLRWIDHLIVVADGQRDPIWDASAVVIFAKCTDTHQPPRSTRFGMRPKRSASSMPTRVVEFFDFASRGTKPAGNGTGLAKMRPEGTASGR